MGELTKQFRKIFVVQEGHNFSALRNYCEETVFLTDGSERVEQLVHKLSQGLRAFDPDCDAIVSVGRANATLLTGLLLGESLKGATIYFGVYRSKMFGERSQREEYQWVSVTVAG
jgi:hypothetical protein